jgi:hypothetical protein
VDQAEIPIAHYHTARVSKRAFTLNDPLANARGMVNAQQGNGNKSLLADEPLYPWRRSRNRSTQTGFKQDHDGE